ncbi:RAD55 family ATPase [Natronobacterium gregoryi]|uniref:RecA-superfamily ATPase possibly involved in signal transduction n=2 Tax=Natronobacterium gregoryi TaxID=44930 RepID=L0AMT8_NATGS|nr:hypothetical protein [Natronobacterium gregoryi]AFZ74512.1 RecA-superfamily ATPase possibly involved in signal transduction [Natronobacterium gregoryi SP2]ELY72414.1 hypothetical protein C490_03683 [Natronobacterium gregoryi SP2]PLK21742.1 recombinase RecA [Natronobacterium gregoryi SP2]SFI97833.1 hypothetical protein SAMN05443661_110195 [Natronobacterium gregoryi]
MYEFADIQTDATIAPGTNILVTGPPLTGKRQLALDVLAQGAERGDGSIIVTTKDNADTIRARCSERTQQESPPLGIVDCVSNQQSNESSDSSQVSYVSSPVDMTSIGIAVSRFLEEFYEGRGITENRVMLHSISTLLLYSDLETVFRFLHVFTGRIQSADGLGIYLIDSTAHDEQTVDTLKQLFDGVVNVAPEDGTETTVTTTGLAL